MKCQVATRLVGGDDYLFSVWRYRAHCYESPVVNKNGFCFSFVFSIKDHR